MASRAKQKEEARARRLAEEQAHEERVRRQRRLQVAVGLALVVAIVVAVVIAISGGSSGGGLQKGTKLSQTKQAVVSMFAGIPQSGPVLGRPGAKVTMIYYGDLECPVCRDFTLQGGFPQLVANDVKAGKVKIEYRAFETATPSPTTFQTQQVAALAAGKQNHFWDFVELFYRQQGQEGTNYVTESYLDNLAQQAGVNLSAWRSARGDSSLASLVRSQEQSGTAAGVNGTPTLIFEGPKGKATASQGVPSYSSLEKSIQSVT